MCIHVGICITIFYTIRLDHTTPPLATVPLATIITSSGAFTPPLFDLVRVRIRIFVIVYTPVMVFIGIFEIVIVAAAVSFTII
jgi:hypothetical protein